MSKLRFSMRKLFHLMGTTLTQPSTREALVMCVTNTIVCLLFAKNPGY
jgi:hypothetical protein